MDLYIFVEVVRVIDHDVVAAVAVAVAAIAAVVAVAIAVVVTKLPLL